MSLTARLAKARASAVESGLALSFFTCQASWQGSKLGGVHALACKLVLRPDKPAGGMTTPAGLTLTFFRLLLPFLGAISLF